MDEHPEYDPEPRGPFYTWARRVYQVLLVPLAAWVGLALHRPHDVVVLAVAVVAIAPLSLILPAGAKGWLVRHGRPLTMLWFFAFTTGVAALLSGLPVRVCALIALPTAVLGFFRSRPTGHAVGRLRERSRSRDDRYEPSFWDTDPSELR